jgi:prohibitin 1
MERLFQSFSKLGFLVVGAGLVNQFALYNVDGGERGVIFDRFRGVLSDVSGEGTHMLIPFVQKPIIMDIRSTPRIISSNTGTKDLQTVSISLRVLSHPVEEKLPAIYNDIGRDFNERILPSIGNEVLKAVVARYNAEDLLRKREQVSQEIRRDLKARAVAFHLVLDDVAITHLRFGNEFARAIEEKQVAQQEAERQNYIVMQSDQEAKAAIIRSEGEAEAAELISEALKDMGPGYIEVKRIDTAKDIALKLARSRNVTYLPSSSNGSNLLLGLNTSD